MEVCRDGHRFRQTYARGVPVTDLEKLGPCGDCHGTTIHFLPDTQIFDDLNFNFSTLSQRLREVAFLNRSLRITLTDEREEGGETEVLRAGSGRRLRRPRGSDLTAERVISCGLTGTRRSAGRIRARAGRRERSDPEPRSVTYCYDGGIVDFVKHINTHKDAIHPRVIHFEGAGGRPLRRVGHAVERRLQRQRVLFRQQHQHPRGRHASLRLQGGHHPDASTITPVPRASSRRRRRT